MGWSSLWSPGFTTDCRYLWLGRYQPETTLLLYLLLLSSVFSIVATGPGTAVCKGIGQPLIETVVLAASFAVNLILSVALLLLVGAVGTVVASATALVSSSMLFVYLFRRWIDLPTEEIHRAVNTLLLAVLVALALRYAVGWGGLPGTRQAALISVIQWDRGWDGRLSESTICFRTPSDRIGPRRLPAGRRSSPDCDCTTRRLVGAGPPRARLTRGPSEHGTAKMHQLLRMIRAVYERRYAARNPVGFARSLGIRVGANVRVYEVDRGMFGTEPWLITIGDNTYITAGVQFVTHDGGTLPLRREVPDLDFTAPITIGNHVYIGMRSIILPGVTIGTRCVVGPGSVVARSIPDNSVAAGVPARIIKTTDDYLEGLKRKSSGCGHLDASGKEAFLKRHFGITHVGQGSRRPSAEPIDARRYGSTGH